MTVIVTVAVKQKMQLVKEYHMMKIRRPPPLQDSTHSLELDQLVLGISKIANNLGQNKQ